jgi:hypothetical protein
VGSSAHAHFFGIGKETGKRRDFGSKKSGFVGDFEDFWVGNETAYYYTHLL